MLQFLTSSRQRSSTPSTFSSPALPELSIDASLQRLHHQEDISSSSVSSVDASRRWLRKEQIGSPGEQVTSPIGPESAQGEGANAFRFPALVPFHPLGSASATHTLDPLDAAATLQEASQARPRTSRGLSYPKPFLSSSRTSSIDLIAESDHQHPLPDFETTQRSHSARYAPQPESEDQNAVDVTTNVVTSDHRRKLSKNPSQVVANSPSRDVHAPAKAAAHGVGQSSHLHASQVPERSCTSSSWTVLLAPLGPSLSAKEGAAQDTDRSSILLPLMSSFEGQVEHLRPQITSDEQSIDRRDKIDLFLDLSSVSVLSSGRLARLTPQSWSIIFSQYLQKYDGTAQQPSPFLYRETGLPIVAMVRYSMTTATSETRQEISAGGIKARSSSLHSSRKQYQSSRRSSQSSVSSDTTSPSPRSTRPTSFHSSHARKRSDSHREASQDADESDPDIGARFWTQFHSLGRQISRENHKLVNIDRRGGRTVSLSSSASDASVFDFSPLGILVPTNTAVTAELPEKDKIDRGKRSIPFDEGQMASTSASLASEPQSATPLWKRRRAYSSMVPLTGWRAGDNDLNSVADQTDLSVQRLPQVLLVEPGEGVSDDGQGNQLSDSITPTVSTFQGRTRALSYQLPQKVPEDPARSQVMNLGRNRQDIGRNRQDIWDEAMSELNERLGQSLKQSKVVPRGLVGGLSFPGEPQSPGSSDATTGRRQTSVISPTQLQVIDSATVGQSATGSASLPGLFYDPWVEQVDGAVDGQLGRRRSTSRAPSSLLAGNHGTREHDNAASKISTPASDSTAVDSVESERPIQSPQALEPPPLSSCSNANVSRERALVSAYMLPGSPFNSHTITQGTGPSRSVQDASLDRGTRRTASEDIGSVRPSSTDLEPVWLTRSQSVSLSALAQPSFNDTVQQSGPAALPESSDPITQWANMAQRLDSPGSLRLLCLAAANWSPNGADGTVEQRRRGVSGFAVPVSSLTRFRSLGNTQYDFERQDTRATIGRSNEHTEATPRRAFFRDRAATLAPIHIPSRSASGIEEAPRAVNVVGGRMRRSLSNIFDLPSPVTLRPGRE